MWKPPLKNIGALPPEARRERILFIIKDSAADFNALNDRFSGRFPGKN
jgi:hypothetical protein